VENSLNALKKSNGCGKVFLAAEYWDSEKLQKTALKLGYGVLYENGNGLSVIGGM
jgi:hypothetical protein